MVLLGLIVFNWLCGWFALGILLIPMFVLFGCCLVVLSLIMVVNDCV